MQCNKVFQWMVIGLHICVGLASGLGALYALIRWDSEINCLPPMVESSGRVFKLKGDETVICEGIFGFLVFVFVLNLSMAGFFYCLRRHGCFMFLHLFITLIIAAVSVFSASVFSVYKMIWCDNIIQRMSPHVGCSEAAHIYDQEYNITQMHSYYVAMKTQTVGFLCFVPLTLIMVLFYGVALRLTATQEPDGSLRETTPLLVNTDEPE